MEIKIKEDGTEYDVIGMFDFVYGYPNGMTLIKDIDFSNTPEEETSELIYEISCLLLKKGTTHAFLTTKGSIIATSDEKHTHDTKIKELARKLTKLIILK